MSTGYVKLPDETVRLIEGLSKKTGFSTTHIISKALTLAQYATDPNIKVSKTVGDKVTTLKLKQ